MLAPNATHYRAGHWTKAIESMEEAIHLHAKGGNAYNWLILAMLRQEAEQLILNQDVP